MAKSFPNTGATVIDATADLPGSPSEGMMVFQKDTNELKIYDGASWVSMLDTDTPPGLHIASGSFTNAASLIVDDCFSSNYTNYKIIISQTQATNNGPYGQFKMRTGAGDYTAANYTHAHRGIRSDNTLFDTAIVNNTQFNYVASGDDTVYPSSTSIDICSPFLTERTSLTGIFASVESTLFAGMFYTGWVTAAVSFTGFSHRLSAGNMTGKYFVYGYRDNI
jgi:hypothetical protein